MMAAGGLHILQPEITISGAFYETASEHSKQNHSKTGDSVYYGNQ